MRVRAIACGDLPALLDVFRRSVRQVAGRDYSPAQLAAWAPDAMAPEPWAARLEGLRAWVAEEGAAVAGFIALGPGGHVDMLFVAPEFIRRGVASRLMAEAEVAARADGAALLHTEASITARPFFERQGFTVIERQRVMRGGQEFVRYAMERRLGR